MKNLRIELGNLQNKVIGLFKPYCANVTEMVIRNDNGNLHTFAIDSLGGTSENHIPKEMGIYVEFGDGKVMTDMMKNPVGFYEFRKKHGFAK